MTQKPEFTALEQISQRRAKTLTTIVEEAVEQLIIEGELAVGDRVNESALAARLNVSRGPIREACRSLEEAGLLTSIVNRGYFVRELSLEEARDLYEVRGSLADLSARLLVKRAKDKDLEALGSLIRKMDAAVSHCEVDAYYALNVAFHELIVRIANNSTLERFEHQIARQLHQFRRRGLAESGNLAVSNQEHKAILEALATRNEAAASEAMCRHVAGGWSRVSSMI